MNDAAAVHRYRVRIPGTEDGPDTPATVEVRATVDVTAGTVSFAIADQPRATADAVTARALSMVLWHAVFGSLRPNGPQLNVEKNTGHGWQAAP